MDYEQRMKKILFLLLVCYICSFVLMVTSICTSSWYTTHPLAPIEQTSYGSLGLIEHCSTSKGVCKEREGILKFSDEHWPYRPLKSTDFDKTLLVLIISMTCTVIALGLTILLRLDTFNHRRCLRWMMLLISIKSAVLGISAVWYLDTHVRSEQFRRSWSSYVAWLSVGLATLVNIPLVYLIRHKPTTSGNVEIDKFVTRERTENEYILPYSRQQQSNSHIKDFEYLDINDVE